MNYRLLTLLLVQLCFFFAQGGPTLPGEISSKSESGQLYPRLAPNSSSVQNGPESETPQNPSILPETDPASYTVTLKGEPESAEAMLDRIVLEYSMEQKHIPYVVLNDNTTANTLDLWLSPSEAETVKGFSVVASVIPDHIT
ncbi:hypothetical protein IWQ62_002581 [Dispira parvispora]|uniref:Uncharacterized protein n=1 Tax=Dispira parvispora TaxID=1520584 RepID=A0A9W8ATG8_9FUNG|nr:hypothetical protein IWQ62_002581 [Dispira parvispora]